MHRMLLIFSVHAVSLNDFFLLWIREKIHEFESTVLEKTIVKQYCSLIKRAVNNAFHYRMDQKFTSPSLPSRSVLTFHKGLCLPRDDHVPSSFQVTVPYAFLSP